LNATSKVKSNLKRLIDVATFEIKDAVEKIVSNIENIGEMKKGLKRKV